MKRNFLSSNTNPKLETLWKDWPSKKTWRERFKIHFMNLAVLVREKKTFTVLIILVSISTVVIKYAPCAWFCMSFLIHQSRARKVDIRWRTLLENDELSQFRYIKRVLSTRAFPSSETSLAGWFTSSKSFERSSTIYNTLLIQLYPWHARWRDNYGLMKAAKQKASLKILLHITFKDCNIRIFEVIIAGLSLKRGVRR